MKIQRTAIASLVLVALAAVGAAPALANLTVIVPYGANSLPAGTPGFKYVILPIDSALPGFEMPAFDDSTWTAGIAPFGGAGGNEGSCGWLWPQVMTPWNPNNSDLFVRFKTELCPGARSVRIGVSIDNDLALFVNGSEVEPDGGCAVPSLDGLCQTENCAVPDKLVFSIPDSLLAPGENVFAIHARDRHVVAFLDIELSADITDAICAPPNDPPACDGAVAEPGQLWPPNHKWNAIAIGGISDPNGDEVAVVVDSIFQDEPTDAKGNGDGNTCPDGKGIGTSVAEVRAERAGGADGRVYHIGFTATDSNGATCQGTVPVCVPHDQGNGNACIDQGALFNSTVCP